ncbi:MAG TPA: hypothetical protein VLD59_02050 [Steroidobacteraceae bacterium]|nr:hypothetical protein [Steroidobacteraceae bacterium]
MSKRAEMPTQPGWRAIAATLPSAASLTLALAVTPARAETETLDEIVVTGTREGERLVETPEL